MSSTARQIVTQPYTLKVCFPDFSKPSYCGGLENPEYSGGVKFVGFAGKLSTLFGYSNVRLSNEPWR